MAESVLMAYATNYGSTQEVAEAVAETLRQSGLAVDLQPMREVRSLAGYGAVVLGAPLYMFRWHKHARRFLSRHQRALTGRPVAIFATGPFGAGDEAEWQGSRDQLDKELANYPWLAPVDVKVVGGAFDPAKLRFPYKLMLQKVPANDLRDWDAIRAWASELPAKLSPDLAGPGA
jgi:menaquinone-dependent protoporphyrinogen oxidase